MQHHRRGLRRKHEDGDAIVERMDAGWRDAGLTARENAMLAYAEKLTRTPWDMRRADVDGLRDTGWNDGDILRICQVTAYFAFVNRMADGLGVELEPWFAPR